MSLWKAGRDVARTGGTSRLPLPQSLVLGLETHGFVGFTAPHQRPNTGPYSFLLTRSPAFVVQVVPSRIPGETAVIASWPGQRAERFEVDTLIRVLQGEAARLLSPTKLAADVLRSLQGGAHA